MSNKPDYSADFAAAHDMTTFIEKLTGMVSETADMSDFNLMLPKDYELAEADGYFKIYSFTFDDFTFYADAIPNKIEVIHVKFNNGYEITNNSSDSLFHRYARDLVAAYFGDLL